MQRFVFILLLTVFIIPSKAGADEIIKKGQILSLEQCTEIALKNHPDMIAAVNTVGINQSRIGRAKANYYPEIGVSSGYSRYSPASGTTKQSFDEYTGSVTLKQNIYDFGKTATQVDIRRLNLNSSRYDLKNTSEQIIFNVRQAYYGVLKARRNSDVAAETVKQFQQHLEQAKGFYAVGTRPKYDVTKAEVDLGNSKLKLLISENALRTAKADLNNAMGIPEAPEYTIEDNLVFRKYDINFKEALQRAYKQRPDLRSISYRKKASEESVGLAKKDYYPVLSGNADYSWSGERFPLEHGWSAGVTLSFPVFSGFSTKYQVEESRRNLRVLEANEESLKQGIFLEVQKSYLDLKEAEERIPVAELTVKQAKENLDIANGRYRAGVGNPIEVTDAEVALTNAKTSYIEALYDYRVAEASLVKAMGGDK
ncbi:outer membrane protein OprM precursor [bacterium BMS3Bbin06]|nr:outer membrane protein OprM precursor [bacterium BMS3Abin08]GBE34128.1 outer membrane protein OprM precursor [bacterium BMS3Bbin06]HDY71782.1 TolC family protein [Nitrospirota bacterium]